MQYQEVAISETFQDEWSELLRDALNTIGCLRLHNSIEKTEKRFFECIARFEETFTRYGFEQQMTLLFELGAVVAHLYIEKYEWHWVSATDKKKRRFFLSLLARRQIHNAAPGHSPKPVFNAARDSCCFAKFCRFRNFSSFD